MDASRFTDVVEAVGISIEGAGVAVIAVGALVGMASFVRLSGSATTRSGAVPTTRRQLGAAILLGLELLVAGDIIRTVAVAPTFTSVGVLAIIVAIRTFLSLTLEVELSGRWPWSTRSGTAGA